MAKRVSAERRAELTARRQRQLESKPTKELRSRSKYIPAGVNKNTKPTNR